MLNRFVLAEDNLGCCPEGPDDAIDLRFLIIDELDAWVSPSATRDLNRMGSRKGCKRDENRRDQGFTRPTSGSERSFQPWNPRRFRTRTPSPPAPLPSPPVT